MSLPADDQIVKHQGHILSRLHTRAPVIHALLEALACTYPR